MHTYNTIQKFCEAKTSPYTNTYPQIFITPLFTITPKYQTTKHPFQTHISSVVLVYDAKPLIKMAEVLTHETVLTDLKCSMIWAKQMEKAQRLISPAVFLWHYWVNKAQRSESGVLGKV